MFKFERMILLAGAGLNAATAEKMQAMMTVLNILLTV
jgi:hypothetical protein